MARYVNGLKYVIQDELSIRRINIVGEAYHLLWRSMQNFQERKKVLMGKQLEVEAEVCIEEGTLVEQRKKRVIAWLLQNKDTGEVMRILEVDESLKDEEILDIRGIGISLMIFYKFQTPRIFFVNVLKICMLTYDRKVSCYPRHWKHI